MGFCLEILQTINIQTENSIHYLFTIQATKEIIPCQKQVIKATSYLTIGPAYL